MPYNPFKRTEFGLNMRYSLGKAIRIRCCASRMTVRRAIYRMYLKAFFQQKLRSLIVELQLRDALQVNEERRTC